MRIFPVALFFSIVLLFSCTDRDDNLEGVQIRVQNTTETTFAEVAIDSLIYPNVTGDTRTFYQGFTGNALPNTIVLTSDSLETNVDVDNTFEIDTTQLNLFTYLIKGSIQDSSVEVEVLKD